MLRLEDVVEETVAEEIVVEVAVVKTVPATATTMAHQLSKKDPSVRFARRLGIRQTSAGTYMMKMKKRIRQRRLAQQPQTMAMIQIGMWTAAPLIMSLEN
jgi:hypothetical protein